MGKIITFYSFKGGVGRTMSLANIAYILAKAGKKVLAVDWDMEAPGLDKYFLGKVNAVNSKGLIDLFIDSKSVGINYRDYLSKAKIGNRRDVIDFLFSGISRDDDHIAYSNKLLKFDWGEYFSSFSGGELLENLREQWKEDYDFVLIDSRTGVTDSGGICTVIMPDILIPVFVSNEQSLSGVIQVINNAKNSRQELEYDRSKLFILPLPSRQDDRTEYENSRKWLNRFSKELKNCYADYLPFGIEPISLIEKNKIPYVPYYSFGEELAVEREGVSNVGGMGYAYNINANILLDNFSKMNKILGIQEDSHEVIELKGSKEPKDKNFQIPIKNSIQYDIFIAHRFTNHDWAEALAHNLVAQGYKVFFDAWELYGGQNLTYMVEGALKSSRCAILIVTPEAADSGWVQSEYESMFNREQQQEGFFFIPVVWGTFPDFPFLDVKQAVNFQQSSESQYREGFQRLLYALEKTAPGSDPMFEGKLILPVPEVIPKVILGKQRLFAERIFNLLDTCDPVMVLAQSGFNTQHYLQAIKASAESRYGEENVLHIFPPTSLQTSHSQYFSRLARQCGFSREVQDSIDWGECMQQRLQIDDELFLLVSGFENGAEDARRDLAGELRNLIEMHAFNFKLVLFGGERLAAMKYEDGHLSFLNTLAEEPLPSMCEEDVQALYLERYRNLDVSGVILQEILEFSGQHPLLVEACLRELNRGEINYQQGVLASNVPAQLFSRFTTGDSAGGLCAYFELEQLGNYSVWPRDTLIRQLYWQNLLVGDDKGKLIWRSELIRELGKELLGCA